MPGDILCAVCVSGHPENSSRTNAFSYRYGCRFFYTYPIIHGSHMDSAGMYVTKSRTRKITAK